MATSNQRIVQGVIEATNERGIQLGGQWWNFSKYGFTCFNPNAIPPIGTPAQIRISGDSFIQALIINGQEQTPGTPPIASNFQRNGQYAATTPMTPAQVQNVWPATPVTQLPMPAPTAAATVTIPAPTAAGAVLTPLQTIIINTRLKILDALSKAQPEYFTLDKIDEGTEVVRNWEAFVLEDVLPHEETDSSDDSDLPFAEEEAPEEEEVLDDLPGL